MTKTKLNFESSLAKLSEIVETMEKGDIGLEESLKLFEQGITLTRQCQQALETAEQTVKILMEENQGTLTDFTINTEDDA